MQTVPSSELLNCLLSTMRQQNNDSSSQNTLNSQNETVQQMAEELIALLMRRHQEVGQEIIHSAYIENNASHNQQNLQKCDRTAELINQCEEDPKADDGSPSYTEQYAQTILTHLNQINSPHLQSKSNRPQLESNSNKELNTSLNRWTTQGCECQNDWYWSIGPINDQSYVGNQIDITQNVNNSTKQKTLIQLPQDLMAHLFLLAGPSWMIFREAIAIINRGKVDLNNFDHQFNESNLKIGKISQNYCIPLTPTPSPVAFTQSLIEMVETATYRAEFVLMHHFNYFNTESPLTKEKRRIIIENILNWKGWGQAVREIARRTRCDPKTGQSRMSHNTSQSNIIPPEMIKQGHPDLSSNCLSIFFSINAGIEPYGHIGHPLAHQTQFYYLKLIFLSVDQRKAVNETPDQPRNSLQAKRQQIIDHAYEIPPYEHYQLVQYAQLFLKHNQVEDRWKYDTSILPIPEAHLIVICLIHYLLHQFHYPVDIFAPLYLTNEDIVQFCCCSKTFKSHFLLVSWWAQWWKYDINRQGTDLRQLIDSHELKQNLYDPKITNPRQLTSHEIEQVQKMGIVAAQIEKWRIQRIKSHLTAPQ